MLKFLLVGLPALLVVGLLVLAGFYIAPQDQLERSDAIVVVSGGDTRLRTLKGIELYQRQLAPLLIFSGAASDPKSPSNAHAMRDIAIDAGVPPDVIALEEQAQTTQQNANQVSTIVRALQSNQIILVTSPYHQRRAAIEFKQRLGVETAIINHSAPDDAWSRAWWWTNPRGWYLTMTEMPKTLFALLNQQFSERTNQTLPGY